MEQFGGDIMGGGDFVQGDFVLGGFCPEHFVWGFCPGGFCPKTETDSSKTTKQIVMSSLKPRMGVIIHCYIKVQFLTNFLLSPLRFALARKIWC